MALSPARNGKPVLLISRELPHEGNGHLHRVFDRDHISLNRGERLQHRIGERCLAGARGPADRHKAFHGADHPTDGFKVPCREPQVIQWEKHTAANQQPQRHSFPSGHRRCGDPHLRVIDRLRQPQPPFQGPKRGGDIEARERLEPIDQMLRQQVFPARSR